MRTALLVTLLGSTAYADTVRALAPALWFPFNEAAGTTAINAGSLGASYNGSFTPGTGAVAQAGALGASQAYSFDGANSLVTVPAGAYGNYAQMTIAALVKATNAGEGNAGALCRWGANNSYLVLNSASGYLDGARAALTTAAHSVGNVALGYGAWRWVFYTYDNTGDRLVHLYKGAAGAVTESTYSPAPTAANGNLNDLSAVALTIGNKSDASRTFNGAIDEFLLFNKVLTPAQMNQIVGLTSV